MKYKPIKNVFQLFAAFFLLFGAVSCSEELVLIKEEVRTELDSLETEITVISTSLTAQKTARDAQQRKLDSLIAILSSPITNNFHPDVHYTVQVNDGSQSYIGGRVTSLANATVTINQGDVTKEVVTDDTGYATFPGLETGFISVTVEIAGFSDIYMIVDLRDGGSDPDGTNKDTRYASTQAMVFPTSSTSMYTISGTSYYDQDLTNSRTGTLNDPLHPFTGASIYETVPIGTEFRIDCVPGAVPNNSTTRSGMIVDIVYSGLSRIATTDANGNWSISLPVVLLNTGVNFLTYSDPIEGDIFRGTQVSSTGSTEEIWVLPTTFYPNSLTELMLFPGGNSTQDLYYVVVP